MWHFPFFHIFADLLAPSRLTGGDELHSEVHVTPLSHHTVGFFHGHYLLHYGIGVVQVQNAQDLLLHWHKFSIHHNRKYCASPVWKLGWCNNRHVIHSRIHILYMGINNILLSFLKVPHYAKFTSHNFSPQYFSFKAIVETILSFMQVHPFSVSPKLNVS